VKGNELQVKPVLPPQVVILPGGGMMSAKGPPSGPSLMSSPLGVVGTGEGGDRQFSLTSWEWRIAALLAEKEDIPIGAAAKLLLEIWSNNPEVREQSRHRAQAYDRVLRMFLANDPEAATLMLESNEINAGKAIFAGVDPSDLALLGFTEDEVNFARSQADAWRELQPFRGGRGYDLRRALVFGVSKGTLRNAGFSKEQIDNAFKQIFERDRPFVASLWPSQDRLRVSERGGDGLVFVEVDQFRDDRFRDGRFRDGRFRDRRFSSRI